MPKTKNDGSSSASTAVALAAARAAVLNKKAKSSKTVDQQTKLSLRVRQRQAMIPAEPTLLGIPAELRNQIYRYVLVQQQNTPIHVNHITTKQPALLLTCKQLRAEGSPIFHHENTFLYTIWNLTLSPQPTHWIWTQVPLSKTQVLYSGSNSWGNLHAWLKRYYFSTVDGFPVLGGSENRANRVHSNCWYAFQIVRDLWEAGTEWRDVEKVLESFRRATDLSFLADDHFWEE